MMKIGRFWFGIAMLSSIIATTGLIQHDYWIFIANYFGAIALFALSAREEW